MKKNSKGFYKDGRLTYKEYKDGRKVLFALGRVEDPDFQKYICEVDKMSQGTMSPAHVMAMMAVMAFRAGLRLPGTENLMKNRKR